MVPKSVGLAFPAQIETVNPAAHKNQTEENSDYTTTHTRPHAKMFSLRPLLSMVLRKRICECLLRILIDPPKKICFVVICNKL
jgi:hypothetical protein